MEPKQNKRAQQTRERLRGAAHRLFLQQGYLATSIEAILAEAGISSKETLYRYYASKEELFTDVLSHLTMERTDIVEHFANLPTPQDLPTLHLALTQFAREILGMMRQPDYLPLVRMVIAETPRFPQLGTLFFSTVTQRGLGVLASLLAEAMEQRIIAELDLDVVVHLLFGGLLAYILPVLAFGEDEAHFPALDRADALVEVLMRALVP